MDITLFTAITSAVIAITGLVLTGVTNRNAATRAEVDSLRQTIHTLQEDNERLGRRLSAAEAALEDERSKRRMAELSAGRAEIQVAELTTQLSRANERGAQLESQIHVLQEKVKKLEKRQTGNLEGRL